ncbi:Hsp20/alpha crystallin family protein [Gleimia hominis]|uniref:Hsp20/alpha crystallin family protein n=1 Tax=Gleimia hominis TaxID=595468 RepID=A0ABU3I9E8_9ACTO|nr:Hsp20/alpha crystallin family protein [Gleimia hominis]MDT3766995.1 Hsp20/alpha crystallin family protein [Gleimia hominis]
MARYYEPFRDMNRMMDAMLRQTPTSPAMPLDLYRDGDKYYAQMDLPGVDPKSIDIDVEDRTLTVRAERSEVEGEKVEWLTHERPVGTFARQLTLGYGVALDAIGAKYEDGVLTLTIPVAEEAKPRKIQVQHNTGDNKVIDQ